MSGHSKWSSIKRKKGALDDKRGRIFTKLNKEISVAARLGGGDESANPRLRKAITNAKSANMPNDNIHRAIRKGTGELPGVHYDEATYEAYGPGGIAIMLEVITDNKNRTVAELRHLLTKYGGHLGENGSVAWMFDKKGQISLNRANNIEDNVFEAALECGAEDFETEEDIYLITTEPSNLMDIRDGLEQKGFEIQSVEIEMIPKSLQKVEGNQARKLMNLMEALDDNEDINNIYSNFDIDEEYLQI